MFYYCDKHNNQPTFIKHSKIAKFVRFLQSNFIIYIKLNKDLKR